MRDVRVTLSVVGVAGFMLTACNGAMPSRNEACTGVSEDPASVVNAPATHGPGITAPAPVQMRATGGWPRRELDRRWSITLFPMLYIYDDAAHFASGHAAEDHPELSDSVITEAGNWGFWAEGVGNRYYENPGVPSCTQTILLGDDFNFHAPAHGLLFVQYTTPHCANCERLSAAIQHTLDAHPQLPARWVQYDLASTRAEWCNKGYGFEIRDKLSREAVTQDYTCPR